MKRTLSALALAAALSCVAAVADCAGPGSAPCKWCHGHGVREVWYSAKGEYQLDPCGACAGTGRVPPPPPPRRVEVE